MVDASIDTENVLFDFCTTNFLMAVPDETDILSNTAAFSIREEPAKDPEKVNAEYEITQDLTEKAIFFFYLMTYFIDYIRGSSNDLTYTTDHGTLKDIANERRDHVASALNGIIGRRIIDTVGDEDDVASLTLKCYYLGIYLSTQSPELYIKEVNIDSTSLTCIFIDKNNNQKRYGKIDATWSEINSDDQPGESLVQLLQRGYPQNPPTRATP
ncbi:uncharacterized protein LOC126840007 [Adelges cooleyi]|uniref:uncharacterized protein LOC126840007 n=1 Tax=Adelges cooleyi TaxID=133065 RepID=UPI0021806018|nr:uncharacterized protein LOC126840007 [Adelges cooleyi]